MTTETERGTAAARERLHWSISIRGQDHRLDLIPAVIRGSVRIELDGHAVGRLPKPSQRHPWRETDVTVDGETVIVALTWHVPVMRTGVFVGGRSLLDGRTIQDARRAAPSPVGAYDAWLGGLYPLGAPARRPLVTWPRSLIAVAAVVSLGILFIVRPGGLLAGLIATVALTALCAIWFRSWTVLTARAHAWLIARPELGDPIRLVGFFGAFIGYAVVSVVTVVLLVRPLVG